MTGPALTRRKFLRQAAGASVLCGAVGWPAWQARHLILNASVIPVSGLPSAFDGLRVAFLADTHHGIFFPLSYIEEAVRQTNALQPDLILLGGDYIYRSAEYISPVMRVLGQLSAPLGVYAVRGNHDNLINPRLTSQALQANGLREITNTGTWLERSGTRLRLAGVDDCQTGHPDLPAALEGLAEDEPALLLTHNPDFIEHVRDRRVVLAFCGHTHGGQIRLPLVGRPLVPSNFGQKYAYGLVRGPATRVYVTSGVGAIFPPLRIDCPPEIALLTLRS